MVEDARRIGANGHAGKRALQHGGEKRCTEAFAAHVSDQEGGAVIVDREHVEVVASDRLAWVIHACDREVRKIAKSVR